MKKLTRRQQEFLSIFLDLYRQAGEPVHYTTLAEHLGVANVSAYEMLRVLEERGLVTAEYQLPAGARRPGRASVVFRPTPMAMQALNQLAGGDISPTEWEAAKDRILRQVEAGKAENYRSLLEDLLARMPEQRSQVIYGAEMITTIILGLKSVQDTAESFGLDNRLKQIGRLGELGLGAIAGFGMGLAMVERVNRRLARFLLLGIGRFQTVISEASAENRRRLTDFARDVVGLVAE